MVVLRAYGPTALVSALLFGLVALLGHGDASTVERLALAGAFVGVSAHALHQGMTEH